MLPLAPMWIEFGCPNSQTPTPLQTIAQSETPMKTVTPRRSTSQPSTGIVFARRWANSAVQKGAVRIAHH